ncbi:uncharacterized protein LOC110870521 [Helianthus annuus]|uniref:uncharacterized protein LOC110870521 n=1 Tax=Helianthus annuus TaxID=4232 RepID=UPI000B904EDD|nr:uncharacterized protein LOC110870521 [Helianthus annuus]
MSSSRKRTRVSSSVDATSSDRSLYLDNGDCTNICEHCGAFFWFDERIVATSTARHLRYNQCCKGGRVKFPPPNHPLSAFVDLFGRPDFLANIRAYNSMFSMTSFGGKVDDSVNIGSAPYVFKIEGQVYHSLGSLCPTDNESPRFLQMYIYDTNNEIVNRLRFFDGTIRSQLSANVVSTILTALDECNELVRLFRNARDLTLSSNLPSFSIRLYNSYNCLSYDRPGPDCIGAIVTDQDPSADGYDIVIRHKTTGLQRISNLHPLYMALQYPLLFVYGESGWSPDLRLSGVSGKEEKNMSMNMFYSYQLHDRLNVYTLLLRGGRLFQQYLVDAYVCIEQNRLQYYRRNQSSLRSDVLKGIHDAIRRGDTEGRDIGKRTILPSSFTGGPRYMYKHYQDALAICRVHGNPQYFITFTCNVNWPEIRRYLTKYPVLKAQDRPDIIARVFHIKVASFVNFLRNNRPFGKVTADLYTIEFQKRGLPHCHLLLWVDESNKITDATHVDKYISAEIPDPEMDPELHRIVTNFMIHGPCGTVKPNAPCMSLGMCSKNFPKAYQQSSMIDENEYAHYKRWVSGNTVIKDGVALDNRYVVSYNHTLLLRFQAHINVEYCGSSMLIKYLFKYVSKGSDRIRFNISKEPSSSGETEAHTTSEIDEIKNYVDGRFICPHESAWRILDFHIHQRNPAVQVLAVHLQEMQNVTFKDNEQLQNIARNPLSRRTTLTEWLYNNCIDESGRHLTYVDFLSEYRWEASAKTWIRRLTNRTPAIGRLIYVHPTCGETFYLRLLLPHQKGCRSFEDIRTVSGEVCSTYRVACERLGLLGDNREWSYTFNEAAAWATASELRHLFIHMLLYCEVSNPKQLWDMHWHKMADDVVHRHHLNDDDQMQHVLYELELLLRTESSSSLCELGLPTPSPTIVASVTNRLLMEERNYDRQQLAIEHMSSRSVLNPQQKNIYDYVLSTLKRKEQVKAFVYGYGGTGKTFLWTTIISALRSEGKIVLAVAASGIASLLLPAGRTAHSRFKIPLDLTDQSTCYIKKNTHLAQLLTETTLIIWDEAPMNDRRCFESLDRTLKDLLNRPHEPFGGQSILLGGDFRQTLPVIPKASKDAILSSALPRSYLWRHFKVYKLTENMRLQSTNLNTNHRAKIAMFSSWLLDVGDGKLGTPDVNDPLNTRNIEVPLDYVIPYSDNALQELIQFIYDKATLDNPTTENLYNKAIVCPKNETAQEINNMVLACIPGNSKTYLSTDTIIPNLGSHGDIEMLYPTEYLNLLNFSELPPHQLELKVNTPVMLIRNINQTIGLCNGTRLLITQLLPRVIEAQIMTGTAIGHRVYIPRISLTHTDTELPFTFKRKQFPIKLCYAMTINKSQGQSLNKIGVYLPEPVFSHGQLYVALSRATSPDSLKILTTPMKDMPSNVTKNIVYSDFLNEIDINQSQG